MAYWPTRRCTSRSVPGRSRLSRPDNGCISRGPFNVSIREYRGQRIGGQQAVDIAIDRLGGRCLQARLVFSAEALELQHEQAAQRLARV